MKRYMGGRTYVGGWICKLKARPMYRGIGNYGGLEMYTTAKGGFFMKANVAELVICPSKRANPKLNVFIAYLYNVIST